MLPKKTGKKSTLEE